MNDMWILIPTIFLQATVGRRCTIGNTLEASKWSEGAPCDTPRFRSVVGIVVVEAFTPEQLAAQSSISSLPCT